MPQAGISDATFYSWKKRYGGLTPSEVTYVTTKQFLLQFGFNSLRDLPDAEALEDAGLLSKEKLLAQDLPGALDDPAGDDVESG